jgi:hypothetical protein
MTGPVNGIMGNAFVTDLPQMKVDDDSLTEERNRAKFSQSREFKKLKEHLELRMKHYSQFLPGGDWDISSVSVLERGQQWTIANEIIQEFQAVIDAYESAAEVVKNAEQNNS